MHFSGCGQLRWRGALGVIAALALQFALVPTAFAQLRNNPGYDRPGLGFTPAVLQPGDFIVEQGLPDWSESDGASLYDADTLLRVGIGHALELQLGSSWNRLAGAGASADGRGDSTLAMKFAPPANGDFSWGLLGSVEFTDGARAFRNQHPQYLLGASFNWQHADGRATGVYAEAQHGNADSQLLAVNESWSLTPRLGVYAELAAQHETDVGTGSMAGAGLTFMATPRVQLDISARRRVAGYADTWEGGFGVAVYFGD